MDIGIQLYSLRDEKDLKEILINVAKIGYKGVEFAGYGDYSCLEIKNILDENDLKSYGNHISLENLENNLDLEIEINKVLETDYIVCPWSTIKNLDDTLQLAKKLNNIYEQLSKHNFKFAYHNHNFEFEKENDKYLIEHLIENTNENIKLELDVFWCNYADVNHLEFIEKYKDRIKLIHLKQIDSNKNCVDFDKGLIDFKKILELQNIDYFIVEQEQYEENIYKSLEIAFREVNV